MNKEKIALGTTVAILDKETNTETTLTLVGEGDADITKGLISVASPLGQGLVGSLVGDEIVVDAPAGVKKYILLSASQQI